MPLDVIHMCWAISRMGFRFFVEGIFIYLIINNINQQKVCKDSKHWSKKKMLLFSSFYTLIVLPVSIVALIFFIYDIFLFRLASVSLVFFYSYYKQRTNHKNLVINYKCIQHVWCALTNAIILVLAVHSFNDIGYILSRNFFILTGIYDTVHNVDVLYQLYKMTFVFLDAFFMFLAYKLRFIKIKDLKNMSLHKQIPISFGFCLLSIIYIDTVYDHMPPSIGPYRETLLWSTALILPVYIGFYLTVTHLTRLINIKENTAADENILIWIFNPSIIETKHLNIYDSNTFMANFESNKLTFKRKLKKLGIDNKQKGYTELIFCLILTKLFIGLKGWSFERDIFWQASLVIDVPVAKLREDIANIIEQVWNTKEAKTLIDGYYLPYHNCHTYNQNKHPNVEDFIMSIAKSN